MAEITPVITADQIDTVATLATQIWGEYYPAIISQQQIDYMLEQFQSASAIARQLREERLQYYLLEKAGSTVGYLAVQPQVEYLFLSKLYVRAEQRGRGHARHALDFAVALASKFGLSKLSLTVNRRNTLALRVYTRLGFIQTGSVVTDIGGGFVMDDYLLEKPV